MTTFKSSGKNPYVFGNSDSVHDLVGKYFRYISILIFIVILLYVFSDKYYNLLLPFYYLDYFSIKITGIFFLLISLIWIGTAQYQMKNSWRIGIDTNNKTELVDHGLFAYSRNPVFLGTIATFIGSFLVIPNSVTLVIMIDGYLLIQIQVCLEEEYLITSHGELYKNYSTKVRRWL